MARAEGFSNSLHVNFCVPRRASSMPGSEGRSSAAGRPFAAPQWEATMAESLARLNVTQHKDISVVEFTENKILDEMNITEIGAALTALAESKDRPKVLLDFGNVD